MPRQPEMNSDYGVDAPGVVRNLLIIGAAAIWMTAKYLKGDSFTASQQQIYDATVHDAGHCSDANRASDLLALRSTGFERPKSQRPPGGRSGGRFGAAEPLPRLWTQRGGGHVASCRHIHLMRNLKES